jgi:hypothetical protein
MKFENFIKSSFAILLLLTILTSCNEDDKQVLEPKQAPLAKSLNPFPFYKSIEIKPGYYFEVVSWGKGVDTIGNFLILMSDSVKNKYKSISVERNGIITDAWNMDLDNDGNPEIYVQSVVRKNVNDLNVYEFNGNDFNKISFPGITSMKGYEGNDNFFVKNGDLFRAIPIVQRDSGKTTTLIKTIKYRLGGNSFSSSEVKPGG